MIVRCDKAMRRSKERTREMTEFGVPRWRCTGKCDTCICGIIKHKNGMESHVNLMLKKGETNAEIHNTTETDHEEE